MTNHWMDNIRVPDGVILEFVNFNKTCIRCKQIFQSPYVFKNFCEPCTDKFLKTYFPLAGDEIDHYYCSLSEPE